MERLLSLCVSRCHCISGCYACNGLIKKDKNLENKGWEMVGSLVINTAITQGLKIVVNRDRPFETYPDEVFPYKTDNSALFLRVTRLQHLQRPPHLRLNLKNGTWLCLLTHGPQVLAIQDCIWESITRPMLLQGRGWRRKRFVKSLA
jgi:hypothetical protein